MSETATKWVVVTSNVAYLFPPIVCWWKMTRAPNRRMDKFEGWSIIVLFVFIAIFSSWSYHVCRADLGESNDLDTVHIAPCETCPTGGNTMAWTSNLPGSTQDLNFQTSRFIDYLLATFAVVFVLMCVIPLHNRLRLLLIIVTLCWMVLFLSTGNDSVALLPALMMLIFLGLFWYSLRCQKSNEFWTRNKMWTLAVVCFAAAVTALKVAEGQFWIWHSLWHVFSALGAALLLMKTSSCYQDVNLKSVDFPRWMESMFVRPGACKGLDV